MRGIVSVVVVAFIVVMSVGMLLPRLGRGRGEAGQVYCLENLRGYHQGLFLYHEWYGSLPPAVATGSRLSPEQRVSWQAELLPFLGENHLYALVDSPSAWQSPVNQQALQRSVPVFRCPSAVGPQPGPLNNLTHYIGLAGLDPDAARLPLDHARAGCFGYRREVTLDYIRAWDGTSATILVMETARGNGPWLAGGPATTRGLDPARPPYLGGSGQFGGTHPTGANALFADGSARLQAPSITPRVLEALVTIGGE